MRPIGAALWFSLPFRLGVSPAAVLLPLHGILLAISIALSLPALVRLLTRAGSSSCASLWLRGFILLASIATHVIFFLPVFWVALSDAPANLTALIALWLLLLLPPQGARRTTMLFFAGLALGTAAWIRLSFLYVLFAWLTCWVLYWAYHRWAYQRSRSSPALAASDLVVLIALLPIAIQYFATWRHYHAVSYISPEVSEKLWHEHRDNRVVGCDALADQRQEWDWHSRCGDIQGLVPALQEGDFHSVYCLLSGRLNFYFGSYSPVTYTVIGGYEGLWGRNLLLPWKGNENNSVLWHFDNLKRESQVATAPDKNKTADRLSVIDPQQPGEIFQAINLVASPRPYAFSTWLWTDASNTGKPTMQMQVRHHQTHEVIAEKLITENADKQVWSVDALIQTTGDYDVVLRTIGDTKIFYLWDELDLRLPERQQEGSPASRIRFWSPALLALNAIILLFALAFVAKLLQRSPRLSEDLFVLLFVALVMGQAILSLPEQRFIILPMIMIWIFAANAFILLVEHFRKSSA